MNTSLPARRSLRFLARLCLSLLAAGTVPHAGAVDLADQPLFSTTSVPGNLLLALSVEFPTADSSAYFSTNAYASATTYLGYFDPGKCYVYKAINAPLAATPTKPDYSTSYFAPNSLTADHTCKTTSSLALWSGNYLNWSSMQSLDTFRWVLTGGNRIPAFDTTTTTILQKTYHDGQDSGADAPNKSLPSGSVETGATPFSWSGGLVSRTWGAGVKMWVTSTATLTAAASSITATDYTNQSSPSAGTIYAVYMNVKVCDPTAGLESNCVAYGSNNYKPEGLLQQYSSQLRYGAVGYIIDQSELRDGGVLRARMNYVGPTQPVPGSAAIANSAAEWDPLTGIMNLNPDSADATATTQASTTAGHTVTISSSGVLNYLNKFGYASSTYKKYDPVSEMYYAALRYLKHQGNVPEYSSLTSATSTTAMNTLLDGFPVITDWNDPIVYSCQKNFILGIGDTNTNRDEDLPGSTLVTAGHEPSPMPPLVAGDTTINVTTATNMVGQLEGTATANLGTTRHSAGAYSTNFIAGLAYDAHTNDIRPDLDGVQTVNTYWLDVLEYQTYVFNNQYYFATKYGGFNVPAGFSTYDPANGPSKLTPSMWHTNTDTLSGGGTNSRPDNYFTANNADVMRSGLNAAFAKISSEASAANSTSFSSPSPNVTNNGSVSYSATYDPQAWTGQLIASSVTYAADGTPKLVTQWNARDILSAAAVTPATRRIVTCCTTSSTAPGLAFTDAALSGGSLISRTNYTSFAAVPGAASQSKANYLLYLRGDKTQEIANAGAYRTRAYRLGDIVDAKPVAVGAPDALFTDGYNPGYASFKTANASRGTVVYVGANDGMLHAFDGSVGNTTSGAELFAYIPSFLYGTTTTAPQTGLPTLGNPNFAHHYFVDATPGEFDVDFSNTYQSGVTTPNWHTLLIGGLGKGGTGYYALDISAVPLTSDSEATVAGKVLWEFTDSRMGYSYGTPTVVKTKKYGWVVVFTSGYNNSDGVGYFFFVNPKTGALLEAIATGSSASPVNLGQQSAYVASFADQTADAIYGGDLQGNVWRLDVSSATGAYATPTLIATLADASGNPQPITTRPLIEVVPSTNARYVLVGTGRLLADSDISSSAVQSFYAIADGVGTDGGFYTATSLPTGVHFPINRSKLNANPNLANGIGSSPASGMGWYFDLPVTTTTTAPITSFAQRVDVDPVANAGVVVFAGNTPNGSACSPSGTGTVYAVSFATGTTVLQDAAGNYITSYTLSVPGQPNTSHVITDIEILRVNGTLRLVVGDSSGNAVAPPAALSSAGVAKQLNWRDIPATN